MKWILFAAMCCAFSAEAGIYKCTVNGVESYSQDPCADDAQLITVTPPSKISSDTENVNESALVEQCVEVLKSTGGFKDPDSLKVEKYYNSWVQDDSGARRVLMLKINAKNSYGGYGGGEYQPCFLNHNGTKLSDIQRYIDKWQEINGR